MCRLAVYSGPELPLERLLLHPDHSLVQQAWAPLEMREGKLNADGYGFGWYDRDGKTAAYTNPMPIWTDPNLAPLARTLKSSQWFANVRSATRGLDISHANTQPFHDGHYLFLHNGYLRDFNGRLRHRLRCQLDADIDTHIGGSTDSEHIFALFRHHILGNAGNDIVTATHDTLATLASLLEQQRALLNIVIADGERVLAIRHAINGECPSLYFTTREADYPDATLISSEKLTRHDSWSAVPEHHGLLLEPGKAPSLFPL